MVVCDLKNHIVRQISFECWIKIENLIKSRTIGKVGESGLKDGNFEETRFNSPTSLCALSNGPNLFICDYHNNCIRMIDFVKETVFTIAGNAKRGHQDGNAQNSLFWKPFGITIHKNQNLLFVSDQYNSVIRQIDISSLHINRLQNLQGSNEIQNWKNQNLQREVNVERSSDEMKGFNFEVSSVCGKPQFRGLVDGIGNEAKLNRPTELAFSQLDENILYFCDTENNCIRQVNILTKQVSTINVTTPIQQYGTVNATRFGYATGICVDTNENLFICDHGDNSIIKVEFKSINTNSRQVIISNLLKTPNNEMLIIEDENESTTLNSPHSILFDRISNSLIFTQSHSIRQIKLGKSFLELKLIKIFLICRILLRHCEKSISKRLLLQLISIQILQTPSSNEDNNNNNNQQAKIRKIIIEKQNKIIEYIQSTKNSNLHSSRSRLQDILFS